MLFRIVHTGDAKVHEHTRIRVDDSSVASSFKIHISPVNCSEWLYHVMLPRITAGVPHIHTIHATMVVFGCPPMIVKFQPQLL
jgi:hypothetical protein